MIDYIKLRELIADGKLFEALNLLNEAVIKTNIPEKDDVFLCLSQLKEQHKQNDLGLVSFEENRIAINKIRHFALKLINDLEKKYPYKNESKHLTPSIELKEFNNLKLNIDIKEYIDLIASDQYTNEDNDAEGAWSKRYPSYLKYYYADEIVPSSSSTKDTMTFSSWIALALFSLSKKEICKEYLPQMINLLNKYYHYLLKHFSDEDGGFGPPTRMNLLGNIEIHVDIRHTTWAVLFLLEYSKRTPEIREIYNKVGNYIKTKLKYILIHPEDKDARAMTFAVLHRLICSDKIDRILSLEEGERKGFQKKLETYIIEKYDEENKTWGLGGKNILRTKLFMNFIVIHSMDISNIIDKDLKEIIKNVLIATKEEYLIPVGEDRMALNISELGVPDIGITIQFLTILIRYDINIISNEEMMMMYRYIESANIKNCDVPLNYSWYLAQIFELL